MKTRLLGSVFGGLITGVVLLGSSAGDGGSVANADEGPSGHGSIAALGMRAQTRPGVIQALAAIATPVKAAAETAQSTLASAVKATTTPVSLTEAPGSGACAAGMVEIEGDYCSNIEQRCLRWLDPETKMRCAEFAPGSRCVGKTTHKRFCIDQYEYPNEPGSKPVVMKSWYQARDMCASQNKRLCGESEWTLACEGQEHLPYPYGYARNAEACNIDKPHPDVDEQAIANPLTRDAEVARLWQGEPSGAREACVSPYGVHDMTGNVDEWVVNESGHPYRSGLKGGYWGPVRDRCRPMTTAHNEDFIFYQIGFRCCSETTAPSVGGVKEPAVPAAPVEGSGRGTGRLLGAGAAGSAAAGASLAGS